MSAAAAITAIVGAAVLLLGLYVLRTCPGGRPHRIFFLLTLASAAWGGFVVAEIATGDPRRWGPPGIVMTYLALALFVHFTLEFPQPKPSVRMEGLPRLLRWVPRRAWNWDRPLLVRPAVKWAWVYGPLLALGALMALRPQAFGLDVAPQLFREPGLGLVRWTAATGVATGVTLLYGVYSFGGLIVQYSAGDAAQRRQVALVFLGVLLSGALLYGNLLGLTSPGLFGGVPFVAAIACAIVRYHLLVVPVSEERAATEPRFELNRSSAYVVFEPRPDFGFRIFADLVTHGSMGLALTRTSPKEIRTAHGLSQTPLVWVGRVAPEEGIRAVDHPEETLILVANFLESTADGVVLLDAVEYLVQRHGSSLTLQTLYNLREIVARNRGRLIVSVNPRALQEQELSLLRKELRSLSDETGRPLERH